VRGTVIAVAAVLLALSACTSDPPPANPEVPVFTTPAPPSSLPVKPVPKTCGGLATLTEVADILGAAVTGDTLPVVGVPEPSIGRTARLDCYYGVPAGQPRSAAAVWIGLAAYTDAAAARSRVDATVEAEREAGAKPTEAAVGPDLGTLLNAAKRTLVAVRDNTTVVVTVVADLVPEAQAAEILGRLANHVLTPRED
jgi:hypothetical protein